MEFIKRSQGLRCSFPFDESRGGKYLAITQEGYVAVDTPWRALNVIHRN